MSKTLPIEATLPALLDALKREKRAVLQAPPGAGKTTYVPLALLNAGFLTGKIVMLEPRRLAARAAAERMAELLGEKPGHRIGYRMRGESKISSATQIEVITEGILTRMLQDAPDLPGISAVIFDEFHERSLHADLGLALCLEVADALRDDLHLLVMSATLDAAPVSKMMNAPLLTSQGRSFPVESFWLERPVSKETRFENAVADLAVKAFEETEESMLVFLPGQAEIRRVASLLEARIPQGTPITPLYGALDFRAQRQATQASPGRKIVLATSIAETALTLPNIRAVVDGGLARRSEFNLSSGMSRLVTTKVTRAEATQRAGRAGRVAPGRCYKLWTRGQEGAFAAFPPAEIQAGDLTAFALELTLWGADETTLHFLTPPTAPRLAQARQTLHMLGALDGAGKITPHGRSLAKKPLHPRLAHMLEHAGDQAVMLAALLPERNPFPELGIDIDERLSRLKNIATSKPQQPAIVRILQEARRLKTNRKAAPLSTGAMLALAYPDRIAQPRKTGGQRYRLASGKGAILPQAGAFPDNSLIVASDLDGDQAEAKIRAGAVLDRVSFDALFAHQCQWVESCSWSQRENCVLTQRRYMFAALVLETEKWNNAPPALIRAAMCEGIRIIGLKPSKKASALINRAKRLKNINPQFPDLSEAYLLAHLEDWLEPFLDGIRSLSAWKQFEMTPALEAYIGWDNLQKLNREVPREFLTPLGRRSAIDYSGDSPAIALRLQELFGVTEHPMSAGVPLKVSLLSPAGRLLQVTSDLPRFWQSSYADVRKDMRGRYPKHPWPEDPTQAAPTLRAKPR